MKLLTLMVSGIPTCTADVTVVLDTKARSTASMKSSTELNSENQRASIPTSSCSSRNAPA